MRKHELRHLLELLEESIEAQKDCRHAHHCHRLPDLWEIEGILREKIREIDVEDSVRVCQQQSMAGSLGKRTN